MAERKSGPVKPPVIDLTARPVESDVPAPGSSSQTPPAGETVAPTDEPAPSPVESVEPVAETTILPGNDAAADEPSPAAAEPQGAPTSPAQADAGRRVQRSAGTWPAAIGGAVGGAVIATAVCYGLAAAGYWPQSLGELDGRLATLQAGLADSQKAATADQQALAAVNARLSGLETDFAAKLAAATGSLDQVQQAVAKLQAAGPATDLGPVNAALKTLSSRLDAIAAGASSADAGVMAANIATLQQTVGNLSGRLDGLDKHGTDTDAAVQELRSELATAKSAIDRAAAAPTPQAIASAMQLPLLVSALEADFAAGRPFAADLDQLRQAVPDAQVPASVTDAATGGLPAPAELAQRLAERLPDALGVRPPTEAAGWQDQAVDWLKGVLALRPAGEVEGGSPEARLSQLQAAVDRHDFAGASKVLQQLPPAMQHALGDVATQIRALSDADAFIAGLRATALAPIDGAAK